MLKTQPSRPGLLFGSFLYRKDLHSEENLIKLWCDKYGTGEILRPTFNPLISYYQKEMGPDLERFLIISHRTFPRSELLSSKLYSLKWENQFARDEKRTVNIDIGLLSAENFLLATTKNYSHRIFIGEDVFADLTFEFRQGQWQTLPWTYPDYQDPEKMAFLSKARDRLLASFLPMT
ncbi:MAG: DUF4416 family protein [Bacteriovoracaceae bacterium]